jgi:hypothetical protein
MTAILYPPEDSLSSVLLRGWVDPRAIVQLEGLGQFKKIHLIGTWTRDLSACSIVPILIQTCRLFFMMPQPLLQSGLILLIAPPAMILWHYHPSHFSQHCLSCLVTSYIWFNMTLILTGWIGVMFIIYIHQYTPTDILVFSGLLTIYDL